MTIYIWLNLLVVDHHFWQNSRKSLRPLFVLLDFEGLFEGRYFPQHFLLVDVSTD